MLHLFHSLSMYRTESIPTWVWHSRMLTWQDRAIYQLFPAALHIYSGTVYIYIFLAMLFPFRFFSFLSRKEKCIWQFTLLKDSLHRKCMLSLKILYRVVRVWHLYKPVMLSLKLLYRVVRVCIFINQLCCL